MASNLTEEARRKANLRLLCRSDSAVRDIIGVATHVCLYEFDETTQQWEKRQVEGSLFLVRRNELPRFRLIILNRHSQDNFELDIQEKFQLQNQAPFLMFRQHHSDGSKIVRGIWFHDDKERDEMAKLLADAAKSLSVPHQPSHVARPARPPPGLREDGGGGGVDAGTAASLLMSSMTVSSSSDGKPKPLSPFPEDSANIQTPPPERGPSGIPTTPQRSPGGSALPPVLDKKSLQLALLSLIQD
jgi:mRNA-decapping enzyme 1B